MFRAFAFPPLLRARVRLRSNALAGLLFLIACRPGGPARPAESTVVESDVVVPMRDGVGLRADVLRPAGDRRAPALLYRTPYDKAQERRDHTLFEHAVARGYAVVVQDVRGRFASEGDFEPYRNEGRDGYDSVEWVASRPWCDGAVGMVGLSYPGATQWLAAVENPPHLRAIAPAMTFSSHRHFIYAGGVFDLSWIEWIWDEIAPDLRRRRHLPGPTDEDAAFAAWTEKGAAMQGVLPLAALDELREVAPFYHEWLRHPVDDPWWSWMDLPARASQVSAAVLNLSGWYDDSYGLEGATSNFRALRDARPGRAPAESLWIGPWFHDEDSIRQGLVGKDTRAKDAAIDYDAVVLDWMDHYLRGIDNGVGRDKPVRYYEMGAERWRESDSWPPPAERAAFLLAAAKPGRPGRLSPELPGGPTWSAFVSDPGHPIGSPVDDPGRADYRALADRADLLTFDSAPLAHDLEVTGAIDADLFASCDCRDFDVWARLYDVTPAGAALNLMSPGLEVVRASEREPEQGPKPVRPGRIYPLHLRGIETSNLFRAGHRIRVQISASFPGFSRNLQTGASEITHARSRKATLRIYHDREHRSRVVLPVVGDPGR